MGQKLLQITESFASSQTEEDGHFEDPGFFFIERVWALQKQYRKRRNALFGIVINPLNTKRRLLYLKTQLVPFSKHFSSRL